MRDRHAPDRTASHERQALRLGEQLQPGIDQGSFVCGRPELRHPSVAHLHPPTWVEPRSTTRAEGHSECRRPSAEPTGRDLRPCSSDVVSVSLGRCDAMARCSASGVGMAAGRGATAAVDVARRRDPRGARWLEPDRGARAARHPGRRRRGPASCWWERPTPRSWCASLSSWCWSTVDATVGSHVPAWLRTSRAVELLLLTALAVVAVVLAGWAWLVPVALAAPLVGVELWFDSRSRSRRLVPELCGAVGIAAVVASVALAGGTEPRLAAGLWLVLAARQPRRDPVRAVADRTAAPRHRIRGGE